MSSFSAKMNELVDTGRNTASNSEYSQWNNRVFALLSAVDESNARKFKNVGAEGVFDGWKDCRERQLGFLEGLALHKPGIAGLEKTLIENRPIHPSKKVFIVHGHDVETKESVARFIERLRLEPIILHEQPNSGRTIIEKFEVFSDVGFAIVLLTPDDVGGTATNSQSLKPRARQNVILELGYFMGKLSRFRVCALYKHGVEIPSDYQGVLYVELDAAGAWRTKLAQELVQANFSIDLEGLLHT